jgi:tetratricopeptide (TPR) repeat protein
LLCAPLEETLIHFLSRALKVVIGLEKQLRGDISDKKLNGRFLAFSILLIALASIVVGLMARNYLGPAPGLNEAKANWQAAHEAIAVREYPQALAHITSCLEKWPFNAELHFLAARTCRRAGDLNTAQAHLARAQALLWPEPQIILEAQLLRAQAGDVWEVENRLLEKLNTRPPEEVFILEALVSGLMVNDRLDDVLFLTSTWIDSFPEDWLPRIYRGNAQLRLGKTEEAIQDFQRVLELKPDHPESHLALAIILADSGQFEKALPHFQASISRQAEDARVLFGLAFCQYSLGQNQEARLALSQLFAQNKEHPAGTFLQAKIELAEDAPELAYQWLKKADELAPKEVDVTNALMQVCRQLGKTQEADKYQRLLEEIRARNADLSKLASEVKSRPEDAALRFQLGMACLKLGRDQEASHWFQGILWKNPKHLPTLNALTHYYESKGNQKMADHYRRKATLATGGAATPSVAGTSKK